MTDLRTAAQQALEAMDREIDTRRCKASTLRAMIALRAALAQQAEPVEPVAWVLDGTSVVEFDRQTYHNGPEWTPLCKCADTPPQRKPLTEEEATALVQSVVSNSDRPIGMVAYGLLVVGAIERAHKIGDNT